MKRLCLFAEREPDMEFNEKLQRLRKQRGLTQEELAKLLYVSRTAVSKWESGRGYPNIDSLKAIAKAFSVTVDELLSGDELLTIAEEEHRQIESQICSRLFGMLDLSAALFLALPLFGQRREGGVSAVSLLALREITPWLWAAYLIFALGMISAGILTLTARAHPPAFWEKNGIRVSMLLSAGMTALLILSRQPYAALLALGVLLIKAFMLVKHR